MKVMKEMVERIASVRRVREIEQKLMNKITWTQYEYAR